MVGSKHVDLAYRKAAEVVLLCHAAHRTAR